MMWTRLNVNPVLRPLQWYRLTHRGTDKAGNIRTVTCTLNGMYFCKANTRNGMISVKLLTQKFINKMVYLVSELDSQIQFLHNSVYAICHSLCL